MNVQMQSALNWRHLRMTKASNARITRKAKERDLYSRLGIERGVVKSKDDAARVVHFTDKLING